MNHPVKVTGAIAGRLGSWPPGDHGTQVAPGSADATAAGWGSAEMEHVLRLLESKARRILEPSREPTETFSSGRLGELDSPPDAIVVTVDEDGKWGPAVSRGVAHRAPGVLHVAVSVQVMDPAAGWLLQRRAGSKAAFANRWANSCCTHPRPGETPAAAAIRRVREELGLRISDLIPAGVFTYRAVDPWSGLVEHEQDHVFAAIADTGPAAGSAAEVSALARLPFLKALSVVSSGCGTPWAAEVLRRSSRALECR